MDFIAAREIVEREKKNWVKCRTCGQVMHGVFLPTHACGDPTPALDGSRFQNQHHPDVEESSMERDRR